MSNKKGVDLSVYGKNKSGRISRQGQGQGNPFGQGGSRVCKKYTAHVIMIYPFNTHGSNIFKPTDRKRADHQCIHRIVTSVFIRARHKGDHEQQKTDQTNSHFKINLLVCKGKKINSHNSLCALND